METIIKALENKWGPFEKDKYYLKQCDMSNGKKQSYLKQEDFDFADKFKNIYLLYSDEDDKNIEKFTRFSKDFGAKDIYLKGYNHFDGYHRIYQIPELIDLIKTLL